MIYIANIDKIKYICNNNPHYANKTAHQDSMKERKLQRSPNLKVKEKTKTPSKYNVVFHNDDVTTMEFVIDVLISIFRKDKNTATRIMLKVHTEGKGVAGTYTYDIATTKAHEATTLARSHSFPLLITVEEVE